MRKIFSLYYFLFVISLCAQAQEEVHTAYDPVGLPPGAPAWMLKLSDPESVNYRAMEDSFERFMVENPKYRYKTPETKGVINYFRRWQKAHRAYVRPDGSIKMPRQSDFRQFVADINAVSTRKAARAQKSALSDSKWEVISPITTYDWKTRKPYPGQSNIQCFDISKTSPNILYAGAETGMIFKTEDRGEHWTSCTPDFFFGGIPSTIEISHTNPQKVVMGAGSFVWLTEDGGATWTDITPSNYTNSPIRDVIISPTDDTHMIMGNRKGVYKTTDNGKSWTRIIDAECFDLQQKYTKGEIKGNEIYAFARQTSASNSAVLLYYSNDGGETWNTDRMPKLDYKLVCGRIGLSSAENGGDYIYLTACKYDYFSVAYRWPQFFGTPVLLKSTDAGSTWTELDLATIPNDEKTDARGQGYYCLTCTASSQDPETVFLGMLNFYKSTDGGKTFENLGGYYGKYDNIHFDLQEVRVLGNETWVSHDGGLNYSTDFFATRPEVRINGIYASEFEGFGQGWNEDVVAGGRYHNGDMAEIVGKYPGALHMGGGETCTGYVMLSDPHKVAFSDSQNFILSDDMSQEAKVFPYIWLPYESHTYGGYMEFDPRYAQSYLIFRGWGDEQNVLWKTVDDGNSFVELHKFNDRICTYVISRSNPDKLVVSTMNGIYYSMDGGKTFTAYTNLPQEIVDAANFTRVDIHPRNEDEIWVSVVSHPGYIFRTKDNGASWEKLDKGLVVPTQYPDLTKDGREQMYVKRFVLTGNEKNAVYALCTVDRANGWDDGRICERGRVFYKDDTMDEWQDYSEGLPQVISLIRMLPFYKDGKLRVATNNGIWQRDLVDTDCQPIAQPLILSGGKAQGLGSQIQLDSYSIVNQKDAEWEWSFMPEPLSVSSHTVRNPRITVDPELTYNVTLTVTTPKGTDTKTVKNMIIGTRGILDPESTTSIAGQEVLERDVIVSAGKSVGTLSFMPHGISTPLSMQLFSASGQVVKECSLSATEATHVSTEGLAPGTYFYLIEGGGFRKTGKAVVR